MGAPTGFERSSYWQRRTVCISDGVAGPVMDTFEGGMSRHSIIANAVSTVIPNTTLLLHRGQWNDFVISAIEAPYR